MPGRRPVARAQFPVLIPWLMGEGISTLLKGRRKTGVLISRSRCPPRGLAGALLSLGLPQHDGKLDWKELEEKGRGWVQKGKVVVGTSSLAVPCPFFPPQCLLPHHTRKESLTHSSKERQR